MIRRFAVTGAVILVGFGALGWYQLIYKPDRLRADVAGRARPAVTVSAATASAETWQPRLAAVGTLRAINGVTIAPEVDGIVARINFESGEDVIAGTVLAELDVAVETATLTSNESALQEAETTLARSEILFDKGDIPEATFDADRAKRDQAAAEVERVKAVIEQKRLRAPFDGRLGIRQADLGEYLPAGTAMVTLEALDPIFVDFALPEKDLGKVSVGQTVELELDAFADETFAGEIAAIDARVNQNTRNILIRAALANPERKLLPGMFASVSVLLPEELKVVTIPATAVTYGLYGDTVYLVTSANGDHGQRTNADSGDAKASKTGAEDTAANDGETGRESAGAGAGALVATRQVVKIGERRGDQVAVLEGVQAGDEVVTAGQIKLQNGSPVKINNSVSLVAPEARPNQ